MAADRSRPLPNMAGMDRQEARATGLWCHSGFSFMSASLRLRATVFSVAIAGLSAFATSASAGFDIAPPGGLPGTPPGGLPGNPPGSSVPPGPGTGGSGPGTGTGTSTGTGTGTGATSRHESPTDGHGTGGAREPSVTEKQPASITCVADCTKSIAADGTFRVDYPDGISYVFDGTKITILRSGQLLDTIKWAAGDKAPVLNGMHGSSYLSGMDAKDVSLQDYFATLVSLRDAKANTERLAPVTKGMRLRI
jgi:hypothetical protein